MCFKFFFLEISTSFSILDISVRLKNLLRKSTSQSSSQGNLFLIVLKYISFIKNTQKISYTKSIAY